MGFVFFSRVREELRRGISKEDGGWGEGMVFWFVGVRRVDGFGFAVMRIYF